MQPLIIEGKIDESYDGITVDDNLLVGHITQEIWDAKKIRITVEILGVNIANRTEDKTTIKTSYDDDPLCIWCICESCGYNDNTIDATYCGGCGKKIDWKDTKEMWRDERYG